MCKNFAKKNCVLLFCFASGNYRFIIHDCPLAAELQYKKSRLRYLPGSNCLSLSLFWFILAEFCFIYVINLLRFAVLISGLFLYHFISNHFVLFDSQMTKQFQHHFISFQMLIRELFKNPVEIKCE